MNNGKWKKLNNIRIANLPCNQNTQLWRYTNAVNKLKSSKNPYERAYYAQIIAYYLNNKGILPN